MIGFVLATVAALAQTPASESTQEGPWPDWQLAFHGGLLQPLLLKGFNAAVDVRHKRLVMSYSHGEGLDLTAFAGLPQAQIDAGVQVREVWTTGGGVGLTLVDEL